MNAIRKSELVAAFRFPCIAHGCEEAFECDAAAKAGARAMARQAGWDFVKIKALEGRKDEAWFCPEHNQNRLDTIEAHKKNRLFVYSGEASAKKARDEDNIKQAETRAQSAQNRFQRGFARILTGAEMTACMKLLDAMERAEISGNASMAYDGVGIDSLSFGEKNVAEATLNALTFVRRCKMAVISGVQMEIPDAWRTLVVSLIADLNAEDTGRMICRLRKDRMLKKTQATALGAASVQRAAAAIVDIRY